MKNKGIVLMCSVILLATIFIIGNVNAETVATETVPILIHEYNDINVFDACAYYRINDFSTLKDFNKETLYTHSKNEVIGNIKNGSWEYEYIESYNIQILDKTIPYVVEECKENNVTKKNECNNVTLYNRTYKQETQYKSSWLNADKLLADSSKLSDIRLKSTQKARFCADIKRVWTPEGFEIKVDVIPNFNGVIYRKYVWWNNFFESKMPFLCYCPHCSSDTDMVLLVSNSTFNMGAYIGNSLELFWVNISDVNSTWRICAWIYFNNHTDYVMVDATETYQIETNIDEGNSTDYGNPYAEDVLIVGHLNGSGYDSSTYGNHGTLGGTAASATGKIGRGVEFDGDSDYVHYPTQARQQITNNAGTLMAWVKFKALGTDVRFIASGSFNPVYARLDDAGDDTIECHSYDGNHDTADTGIVPTEDVWYHVALVYDSGTMRCYVNGIDEASVATGTINWVNADYSFVVGAGASLAGQWANATMDEAMLSNRTFSADEIMLIYNNTLGTHNVTDIGPIELLPPVPSIPVHSFIIYKLISPEIPFIGWFLETLTFKAVILFMDRLTVTGDVDIGGNLDVTGNITASNIFLPSFISAHTNSTIAVATGGIWYNVTFDNEESSMKERLNHTHDDANNDTFIILDNGTYEITYTMIFEDSAPSPNAHIVTRVVRNNVETKGFTIEEDTTKQNADQSLHHSDLIALSTGDEIKLQFTSDDTTVSLTTHLTYGIHQNTGHITIKRVA